ncbi:ABC transporter ATP-binding protein [Plantactinospora sp. GCM10030261]|uniref:ABC transporter ATP-binding protein n=1 Tax=Plantactinospora sp. GCM10030261 TaxID=3273420 RepID=UPI00361AB63C
MTGPGPDRAWRAAGQALLLAWRSGPGRWTAVLACTVVGATAPVVLALATKVLVNELSSGNADRTRVFTAAGTAAAAGAAALLLGRITGYLSASLERATAIAVEERLFRVVNRFPGLRYFEDPRFHDRLRLAEAAALEAPGVLTGSVLSSVQALLSAAGLLGAVLVIWPPMAVLLGLVLAAELIVQLGIARQRARVAETTTGKERRRMFYRLLLTDPRAAKEVRLYGTGDLFHDRMLHALRESSGRELAVQRRGALALGSLSLLGSVATAVGTLLVVAAVLDGRLTVGDLMLFVAAVGGVAAGLSTLVAQVGEVSRALRLFGHFQSLVAATPDISPAGRAAPALRGSIEFDDVWFRYDETGPWVLRGLTMTIPYGGTVGVVGVNGAGKSTLVKLLCRFYEPQRGAVRWDGVDLRDIEVAELRRRIAVTFQDYMTYDLTLGENIRLGAVHRPVEQPAVRAAARLVDLDTTISALPAGYDTMLSRMYFSEEDDSRGVALSGGQLQRLALARSVLRGDADLLILDEPSAGLDAEAEYGIHRSLRDHRHGRTSLLISHRLSTLRDADTIVVIDAGRVVEQGSHDALMTGGGTYSRLFNLQARGYREPVAVGGDSGD